MRLRASIISTLCGTLLLGSVLSVWWSGSSPMLNDGAGGNWIAFGRLIGLLAQLLLLMELLLIARIPALEHAFGFLDMNRLHKFLGKWSVILLLSHPLFLSVGYAGGDAGKTWNAFLDLLTWKDVNLALLGIIALLTAITLSYTWIRKRMNYDWWYLAHLTMYLSVALIFFHQIENGDVSRGMEYVLWMSINGAILALILYTRFLRVLLANFHYQFVVTHVQNEGGDITSVTLRGKHLHEFCYRPGQWAKISFATRGLFFPHPFSFSRLLEDDTIRFSIKGLGDYTKNIARVKIGSRVLLDGPYGHFTLDHTTREKFLLIAGGIGVTPIRSLFEQLGQMQHEAILLYSAMTIEQLALKKELDAIAEKNPLLKIFYFVTKNDGVIKENVRSGMIDEHTLQSLVPDVAAREIFLCGPPGMMKSLSSTLLSLGVPHQFLHTEKFGM